MQNRKKVGKIFGYFRLTAASVSVGEINVKKKILPAKYLLPQRNVLVKSNKMLLHKELYLKYIIDKFQVVRTFLLSYCQKVIFKCMLKRSIWEQRSRKLYSDLADPIHHPYQIWNHVPLNQIARDLLTSGLFLISLSLVWDSLYHLK